MHERAEERLGERRDVLRLVRAEGRACLVRGLGVEPRAHGGGHVARRDEPARGEVARKARVHRHRRNQPERRGRAGELAREHPVRGRVALHVADLHDEPGVVRAACDLGGVGEREAERLLHEDVRTGVERVAHDAGVRGIGRAHDEGVESRLEQRSMVRDGRDPVPRRQALADGAAGIREPGKLEAVVDRIEQRQVDELRDEPAAGHADAQPARDGFQRVVVAAGHGQ